MQIFIGVLIPFLGTILGAAMVFFVRRNVCVSFEKFLLGFSAGVMIAASIWSLLIPSIELSKEEHIIPWIPSSIGFVLGIIFLVVADIFFDKISNLRSGNNYNQFKKTMMIIFAVTLHNIPEGMAVGVVFSGVLVHSELVSLVGAMTFAIGIAIQNFPEGAIISMPLRSKGMSKVKSFYYGVLSGIVEPIGAGVTIMLSSFIQIILPYLLSFAAGAMMYVVVLELIPDAKGNKNSYFGLFGFTIGFIIMMILDVAFS